MFGTTQWCSGNHSQQLGRASCMSLAHSVASHGWLDPRHRSFEPPKVASRKYGKHFLEPLPRPHHDLITDGCVPLRRQEAWSGLGSKKARRWGWRDGCRGLGFSWQRLHTWRFTTAYHSSSRHPTTCTSVVYKHVLRSKH